MRIEDGEEVPSTLGEYRDLCAKISLYGDKCLAVKYLDEKIKEQGRDMRVIASDSQMRFLLMPRLLMTENTSEEEKKRIEEIFKIYEQ